MLADFVVNIPAAEDGGRNWQVQVKVHDSTESLQRACRAYHKRIGYPHCTDGFEDVLGICHRFYSDSSPLVALVRVAPPNLGIGIISHELVHAAVSIWEAEHDFKDAPIDSTNDERFAWVLGELVRVTVIKCYEHGIYYDDAECLTTDAEVYDA